MAEVMAAPRNHQLDGWRGIAVLGVMWLHWAIPKWRGGFPFEIGLFFFLTLTGFFITRILLREQDRGNESGEAWKLRAFGDFQRQRALRILVPCYAAMLFGMLVGAPDLLAHPVVYFAHLSNFHIAMLPEWPWGTSHYWTLAIQQQFYLFWPLLIFSVPRRWLTATLVATVLIAPVCRALFELRFPAIHEPGAITPCAFDYLGCGSLLALFMHRGMKTGDPRLRIAAWLGFGAYVTLYTMAACGHPVPGLRFFQQTFLSVAMAGLIAATLQGLRGPLGRLLENPALQHIAKISYSLYLFHNLVPMALGYVAPILWKIDGPLGTGTRLLAFALVSWGISWLSWRFIELPMERRRRAT